MNFLANFHSLVPASHKPVAGHTSTHAGRALRLGLLALAFGLLSAGAAHAQQPAVQVTQPDAASLRLRFDNPTTRAAYLTVTSLNSGTALLREAHREPAYGTRLLFDKLPAGTYAVALRLGHDRYRYTVEVARDAAGAPAIAVRETTTHRVESGLVTARF